ncbi:hypothetical protein QN277_017095 [Acacia crassicarpa]|uniref:Endonuclease/exonuclease/phosphatase domain-containing protein n=1 Tax=Acacia crassicarpa TaxID=499986 RepID=A0AAE1MRD9_9FABA|nr:hypothetical protein QN277_017095 [Acacia crassicarpa]
METKIQSTKIMKLRRRFGFQHDLYVDPEGLSGGLAVWWKDNITLNVLYKSKNIIHVVMESAGLKVPKFATFVYGPPKEKDRRVVWNILRSLAVNDLEPWLAVGDFNDLLSQAEKEGGLPRAMRKIINFQKVVSDCNLIDLEFKGSKFTWCNNRPNALVRERLDRALGNAAFRDDFDHAMVFNVEPLGSDHHALVVDCWYCEEKSPKQFKFEASWVQHEEFLQIVAEGWNGVEGIVDNKMKDLIRRLEACKKHLLRWSKSAFPNFKKVIEHLRNQLERCFAGQLSDIKFQEAEELVRLIEEAWDREESYWWQRSRISWLNCGDRNTRFFHCSVIQRRQRNKILRLKDENGIWLEERDAINNSFSAFYQNLFSSGGSDQ